MEESSLLVIQGEGHILESAGTDEMVKEVVEAVKAAEGKISVAVMGVLRYPREGREFERMRRETNQWICKEFLKIKMEWLTKKKGNVSFLDQNKPFGEMASISTKMATRSWDSS